MSAAATTELSHYINGEWVRGKAALLKYNWIEKTITATASHGSLGVQLSNDTKNGGAAIAEVVEGSPAAAAGVPSGAVITKIDGQVIDGPEALVAAVRSKAPGDKVSLTYLDDSGAAQTTQVTLGKA